MLTAYVVFDLAVQFLIEKIETGVPCVGFEKMSPLASDHEKIHICVQPCTSWTVIYADTHTIAMQLTLSGSTAAHVYV